MSNGTLNVANTSGGMNALVGSYMGNGYVNSATCTCGQAWHSVMPPPACPLHSGLPVAQQMSQYYPDYPLLPDFDEEPELTNEEAIAGLMEILEDL